MGKTSAAETQPPTAPQIPIPQMVVFAIQGGVPVTDEEGRLVVDGFDVEGEVIEEG